mgnify:CR=1 FL=1
MDSIRQNKVARLIQRDLSEMFQQECKEYTEGADSYTQLRAHETRSNVV